MMSLACSFVTCRGLFGKDESQCVRASFNGGLCVFAIGNTAHPTLTNRHLCQCIALPDSVYNVLSEVTLPNTVCIPFRCGCGEWVMKN